MPQDLLSYPNRRKESCKENPIRSQQPRLSLFDDKELELLLGCLFPSCLSFVTVIFHGYIQMVAGYTVNQLGFLRVCIV